MLQILERRYPLAEVCVYPCLVQGDSAPQSIAEALTIAGNDGCDVILMGRGGGASEDLSAFQEEIVAHAIYCSPVPVISAVGHETDHCIADAVADLRAPTPSAAAELAVPDIRVLAQTLALRKKQLDGAFFALFDQKQQKLSRLMNRLQMQAVDRRVEIQQERFLSLNRRFRAAMERTLTAKQQDWQMLCARLETVSPIAILQRGYSLVYDPEGKLIRSSGDLRPEDRLEIRFAEGSCTAVVKTVELQEESSDEI
jgi:exodeoxyribonuclease VII large subunit